MNDIKNDEDILLDSESDLSSSESDIDLKNELLNMRFE